MFSVKEYESRVNKVRTEMSNRGLSALVILDNESYMDGGNLRYLTNFLDTLTPKVGAVVVTSAGVTLCVNPGFRGCAFRAANQVSWVKDMIGTRSGLWGQSIAQDIKTALTKANVIKGKIGVDGFHLVTEPVAKSVRAVLSGYELVENTGIVDKVRMVKSPAEFEVICEASRLADIGLEAFIKAIKPGVSVATSISDGEHTAKAHGAESAFMIGTPSDSPFMWGVGALHSSLGEIYKEGDMVAIELNAGYQGYYGQVARSFVIGKASAKQKRIYDTAMAAYEKSVAMLKPGVKASEVFKVGIDILTGAGYERLQMRNGHGMGLTIAEGFNVIESDDTEIRPGFYVMIHINAPHDNGVILVGNALRVTEAGCEELNKVKFRLEL